MSSFSITRLGSLSSTLDMDVGQCSQKHRFTHCAHSKDKRRFDEEIRRTGSKRKSRFHAMRMQHVIKTTWWSVVFRLVSSTAQVQQWKNDGIFLVALLTLVSALYSNSSNHLCPATTGTVHGIEVEDSLAEISEQSLIYRCFQWEAFESIASAGAYIRQRPQ